MRIERHDEPAQFFALVAPFLERREAEHNLQLGFRARLEADRHAYGPRDPLLYAVLDDGGDVAAVATQTPPFGLVLSEIDDPAIVDALADRLAADGAELPTAGGPGRGRPRVRRSLGEPHRASAVRADRGADLRSDGRRAS